MLCTYSSSFVSLIVWFVYKWFISELHSRNISPGKPTFQYPYDEIIFGGLHKSQNAIDGYLETFSHTTDFIPTIHKEKPYWMIDLLTEVLVHKVLVICRIDCCGI